MVRTRGPSLRRWALRPQGPSAQSSWKFALIQTLVCFVQCSLTQTLPQCSLGAARVFQQIRTGVELHRQSLVQVVLRPARIAACGKAHPGGMHLVIRLLRRGVSQEHLHASDTARIEDEPEL